MSKAQLQSLLEVVITHTLGVPLVLVGNYCSGHLPLANFSHIMLFILPAKFYMHGFLEPRPFHFITSILVLARHRSESPKTRLKSVLLHTTDLETLLHSFTCVSEEDCKSWINHSHIKNDQSILYIKNTMSCLCWYLVEHSSSVPFHSECHLQIAVEGNEAVDSHNSTAFLGDIAGPGSESIQAYDICH